MNTIFGVLKLLCNVWQAPKQPLTIQFKFWVLNMYCRTVKIIQCGLDEIRIEIIFCICLHSNFRNTYIKVSKNCPTLLVTAQPHLTIWFSILLSSDPLLPLYAFRVLYFSFSLKRKGALWRCLLLDFLNKFETKYWKIHDVCMIFFMLFNCDNILS